MSKSDNRSVKTYCTICDDGKNIHFKPVVGDKELSMFTTNEDVALLLAIGFKYEGNNDYRYFVRYACKMLGIKSRWAE